MDKNLQVKGYFKGKEFKPTHVKITKEIAECKENKSLKLKTGYIALVGCDKECPEDTSVGYYQCVAGNCVYIPFS